MPKVYLRGPSTGTSTGGGTGGGTGSSGGGYDRYVGTLGAIADKPNGSKFTHYEAFPAAEKYDWIRVVTSSKINNINLKEGQEWICNTKTEKDLPENWEIRSSLLPYSDMETITYPGHSFVPGNILRKSATNPFWYLAYLTEFSFATFSSVPALSNFGNILVTQVTENTFSIPKTKGLVTINNHQLGAVGEILLLNWSSSSNDRGTLTNYSPRAGDFRVYIATVYDENTLDYNPSSGYEVVV